MKANAPGGCSLMASTLQVPQRAVLYIFFVFVFRRSSYDGFTGEKNAFLPI
jgi:hypothetical protein